MKHEALLAWGRANGIVVNGVAISKLKGRGRGMIATRKMEVGINYDIRIRSPIHSVYSSNMLISISM